MLEFSVGVVVSSGVKIPVSPVWRISRSSGCAFNAAIGGNVSGSPSDASASDTASRASSSGGADVSPN